MVFTVLIKASKGGVSDNNAEEVTLGMLKDQIGQLAKLVTENIAPVVNNLKEAYDDACEQYVSVTESEEEIVEHDDVVDDEQPPRKKVLTESDSFLDALEKAVKNDDGPAIDDRLANIINTCRQWFTKRHQKRKSGSLQKSRPVRRQTGRGRGGSPRPYKG